MLTLVTDGDDSKENELPKLCGGGVGIGDGTNDPSIGSIGADRDAFIWLMDGVRGAKDIDGDGETVGNDMNELFEVLATDVFKPRLD